MVKLKKDKLKNQKLWHSLTRLSNSYHFAYLSLLILTIIHRSYDIFTLPHPLCSFTSLCCKLNFHGRHLYCNLPLSLNFLPLSCFIMHFCWNLSPIGSLLFIVKPVLYMTFHCADFSPLSFISICPLCWSSMVLYRLRSLLFHSPRPISYTLFSFLKTPPLSSFLALILLLIALKKLKQPEEIFHKLYSPYEAY